MTAAGAAIPADQGRRISVRAVVAAALGTYRRRFWRVALAAAVIVLPLDFIVSLLEELARLPQGGSAFAWGTRVGAAAANTAVVTLGTTFFAGFLDRVVAADQHGGEDVSLGQVLRELPFGRLIIADLAAVAIIIAGVLALLIPGLIAAVLLGIVGPLIVIEDLRVWPALRRSAQLVRPHFFMTFLLVLVPMLLEESLLGWMEGVGAHAHLYLRLPADLALTVVVASFVGMLEITLAHGLIADQKYRRAQTTARAEGAALAGYDGGGGREGGVPAAPGGGGAAG
jgi:hypothetical protein